jgi:type IV secretion system protein VirD4
LKQENRPYLELRFVITRNLAAMEPKEREAYRAACLLYNAGKIDIGRFIHFAFALINGNGKASIQLSWWWDRENQYNIKDQTGALKVYQDLHNETVDAAITELLELLNQISRDDSADESLRDLGARLRGGSIDGDFWLRKSDIAASIFRPQSKFALRLGTLPDGTMLEFSGPESLITIAPPRTGKTQCHVLPNMLTWPGPAVVLDIKGEIYDQTHRWREANVGPVHRFSPLDPAQPGASRSRRNLERCDVPFSANDRSQ